MTDIILIAVAVVFAWLYFRDHVKQRKLYNNERERRMLVKKYMDLHAEQQVLGGTLRKAEALNGKYTLILNVLKSRFPHAWEIAINEVFPEKAVQVSGCASESGAGDGLDSRLRGNDGRPAEASATINAKARAAGV